MDVGQYYKLPDRKQLGILNAVGKYMEKGLVVVKCFTVKSFTIENLLKLISLFSECLRTSERL